MSEQGMTPEQVVGARIAQARADRGIRQDQLGARLEDFLGKAWKKQAISDTERGNRRLDLTELLAFAAVLDYPVSWFFVPPADMPSFRFPARMVPVNELADGALLGGADRNMLQALAEEQMAILNEANRRTRALIAITGSVAQTLPALTQGFEANLEEGKTQ